MEETTQKPASEPVGNGSAQGEHPAGEPKSRAGGPVRKAGIAAGIVVALLIVVWGVRWIAYATAHQTTDDARVDADTVTVTSKISERVAAIYTDTNLYVHKGQLLIQLDDRDERARYAQALAALRAQQDTAEAARQTVSLTRETVQAQTQEGNGGITSAQSGIASAEQQVAVAEQGILQARSQLSAARAGVPAAAEALAKANADYQRALALVATGDIAKANLDAARAAQQAAQAEDQQARDNVAVAEANVDAAIRRAAAARAQVAVERGQLVTANGKLVESSSPYRVSAQEAQAVAAQAQSGTLAAQLRTAEDQLSYTKITAPIDGYVGIKSVDIGQQVSAGSPLLTIVPLEKVYITANYKETQIGRMRPGQQVDISVDAYKGVRFSGHVDAISPASQNTFALVPPQNASGNFVKVTQRIPVRIYVDSASKPLSEVPLRPGMSVVASVKVK